MTAVIEGEMRRRERADSMVHVHGLNNPLEARNDGCNIAICGGQC